MGNTNNPTRIESRRSKISMDINPLASWLARNGAQAEENAKKATFFSTFPDTAKEFSDRATDPEVIHEWMQRDHEKNDNPFPYYRLIQPGGLKTEFDEWKPKHTMYNRKEGGAKTIADIKSALGTWTAKLETILQFQECAAALVARRRERMTTSIWER